MIEVDVKMTPLLEYYESLGYNIEIKNDVKSVVKEFNGLEPELHSLFKGVGLKDSSAEGILELRGKDVLDFLHRITTNAVKDIPKGSSSDTIFTTEKGRIIDVSKILNFDAHQLVLCSAENKVKVIRWIEKYVIMDDVNVTDASGKYAVLDLIGPQADSFITLICGKSVNEIQPNSFKVINSEGVIFILLKFADKLGNNTYKIIADMEQGLDIVKYMIENKGPFDFNLIGEEAYNNYRIELGIPSAENELNDDFNPHEAGLRDLISFTKGCYIGQEVIARLDTYDKVQKHLMGVCSPVPFEGSELLLHSHENKEAGKITSTTYSNRLKKHIGLAYVRKNYQQEGNKLKATLNDGNEIDVTIHNLPFKR